MKSKRGILLLLVLLIVGGLVFRQFTKKKPEKKKRPKPPVEERVAEPSPSPPVASPGAPPALPLAPPPGTTPPPMPMMPGVTPPPGPPFPMPPGATPAPLSPKPGATPGPQATGVPRTEKMDTETQPPIQISMGAPLRLAEGTSLVLEGTQVNYPGRRPLQYQWTLQSGPEDKLELQGAGEMKARLTVGDLDNPQDFILKLRVSDGLTEASGQLQVSAFPAQLRWVGQVGGAVVGVAHLGERWVTARGPNLEIYSSTLEPENQITLDFPVAQFFSIAGSAGSPLIYAQGPEGDWTVVETSSETGSRKSRLPMMGKKIRRRVVPFMIQGQPFAFALLDRGIELWNLSEPRHPRLKSSLANYLKDPLFLTFSGRNIYVADEANIHLVDFSTGQLVASVPAGGSITALATFSSEQKNFLLAGIGTDRSHQGRRDYGLRFFEIAENGRLGGEQRVSVGEGLPVHHFKVIPGADLALLSAGPPTQLQLKMLDLKARKEIPLQFDQAPVFLALQDIETGKMDESRVAMVADGNQLRALTFQAVGTAPTQFQVGEKRTIPGIMSAAWVRTREDGKQVWVGDEGSPSAGALALVDGEALTVVRTENSAGTFPVTAAFPSGVPTGVLLYQAEVSQALPAGSPMAALALVDTGSAATAVDSKFGIETSGLSLGVRGPQGVLAPLGVAAWLGVEAVGPEKIPAKKNSKTATKAASPSPKPQAVTEPKPEEKLFIGVAISRVSGAIGGSGLGILKKPLAQDAKTFLNSDFAKTMTLVPLQDARDVAISPDGKAAFLAGGIAGVIAVDLSRLMPVSRMSLGSNEWSADRVLVSPQGNLVLGSFLHRASGRVIVKIFGVGRELALTEYGTLTGLEAVPKVAGLRVPRLAFTADQLYLFASLPGQKLAVFNLSNPAQPVKIGELTVPGDVLGVSVANRYRDLFLAMGPAGVGKVEFGFNIPKTHAAAPGAETQPTASPKATPAPAGTPKVTPAPVPTPRPTPALPPMQPSPRPKVTPKPASNPVPAQVAPDPKTKAAQPPGNDSKVSIKYFRI